MTQRLYYAAKAVADAANMSLDQKLAINHLREVVNEPDLLATPEELDRARAIYGSDEIEIDEGAFTSRCEEENGLWVSAWVWVKLPDGPSLYEYTCPSCGTEWEAEWTTACDDTCPNCGTRDVSPDGDGS